MCFLYHKKLLCFTWLDSFLYYEYIYIIIWSFWYLQIRLGNSFKNSFFYSFFKIFDLNIILGYNFITQYFVFVTETKVKLLHHFYLDEFRTTNLLFYKDCSPCTFTNSYWTSMPLKLATLSTFSKAKKCYKFCSLTVASFYNECSK